MALVYMSSSSCCLSTGAQKTQLPKPPSPPLFPRTILPSSSSSSSLSLHAPNRTWTHIVRARKGLSSRTRRLENRVKKGSLTTKPGLEEEEVEGGEGEETGMRDLSSYLPSREGSEEATEASMGPMPKLEGLERDFFEGSQWDVFGFVVQYLWAFGIVFALIACGIAVATYNEGATDFKQTPAYKESIQSRQLLEEPDTSTSDVFEGNPTEVAPSSE